MLFKHEPLVECFYNFLPVFQTLLSVIILNWIKGRKTCFLFFLRKYYDEKKIYGCLTMRAVKMAGYWPSSTFGCLWTQKKSRSLNTQANIQERDKLGQ